MDLAALGRCETGRRGHTAAPVAGGRGAELSEAEAAARRRTPTRTGASSGYRSTGLGSWSSGAAAIHGVGQGGPRAAKTASAQGAAALARRTRLRPQEGTGQALHEAPRGGHGVELLGPCVPCEREREQGDEREREKREGKGEETRAQGEGAGLMQRAVAPVRSRRLDREEGIRGWPGGACSGEPCAEAVGLAALVGSLVAREIKQKEIWEV